ANLLPVAMECCRGTVSRIKCRSLATSPGNPLKLLLRHVLPACFLHETYYHAGDFVSRIKCFKNKKFYCKLNSDYVRLRMEKLEKGAEYGRANDKCGRVGGIY